MTPAERVKELRQALRPVQAAPSLRTVNGFGTTVGGRYHDPAIAPLFFIARVPTALFMPLSRGTVYLVAEGPVAVFSFYGRLEWDDFERLYPEASGALAMGAVKGAAFNAAAFVAVLVAMGFAYAGLRQIGRLLH